MRLEKKTKIVATIGPATSSIEKLAELRDAGVDVFRINFSHGSHTDHLKVIQNIRKLIKQSGIYIAILADLQGPKLRIGEMKNNGVELFNGSTITFTNKECVGTDKKLYMTYQNFAKDVKVGDSILLDDGKMMMEVMSSNGTSEVVAKIIQGGILSSKKGVNLPNTQISLPCITEKDHRDLKFALKHKISWIGLSFVRSAADIIELKALIAQSKSNSLVVAKIEKPEAIEDIDAIIHETDALMVARGDLGVEIPMEEVPLTQKMIVEKARIKAKPVIIATQMMESMIENFTPTRAEVNDVANAVLDGADAVMLSGETSVGKFPVEVIKTMKKILIRTEWSPSVYYKEQLPAVNNDRFVTDTICFNSSELGKSVNAKAIITMTFSGYTAFKISSMRPKAGIYVFTSNHKILNMLNLVWGVQAFYYNKFVSTDHTISDLKYLLRKKGYLKAGDFVINIASMPIKEKGMTNMMKLSSVD